MILATILMCLIKEKKTVLSEGEILVSWFCFARKWKFSFLILFCQKVKKIVFWFCFVKKWKLSFLILLCQFAFATDLDCGRCLYTEIHLKIFGCLIFVSTCCNKETIVHHILSGFGSDSGKFSLKCMRPGIHIHQIHIFPLRAGGGQEWWDIIFVWRVKCIKLSGGNTYPPACAHTH